MDFKVQQIQVSRNGTDWYSLDFKGENPTTIEKDTSTETASSIIHGSLFLDKEAVKTDGETQYVPIPTLYKYRMRQVSESGEALDWSDENTPVAEVYAEPIDILKLNVGNLSVNDGKFLSMRGGSMLGFAKDDNLPESQRISAEDTTLNYLDLTNNKMRFGTLNSYMLVDYAKGLVAFKGTELQLDRSILTTNADGVYLKHEGRAIGWGDADFSNVYAGIGADKDIMQIHANELAVVAGKVTLLSDKVSLTGNLDAKTIQGKQFLSDRGANGGYSFTNDGVLDTGTFSDRDGDLYFKKNNVKQDINTLLDGVLSIGKGGTGATTAEAARNNIWAAYSGHTHNDYASSIPQVTPYGYGSGNNSAYPAVKDIYEGLSACVSDGLSWDFTEGCDPAITHLPTWHCFLLTFKRNNTRGFQLCFEWTGNGRWTRRLHDDSGQGLWGPWRGF